MAKASESKPRWDPIPRPEQRHRSARAQARFYNPSALELDSPP